MESIKGLKSDYNETVQDEDNSQMLPLEADIQPGIGYAYVKVDSFALERYPMDKIFFTNLFLEIHDIPNLIIAREFWRKRSVLAGFSCET